MQDIHCTETLSPEAIHDNPVARDDILTDLRKMEVRSSCIAPF